MADADRRPPAAVKQPAKKKSAQPKKKELAGKPAREQFSIKKDLLENTPAYSFFQAIRLLRYYAGREGMRDDERFLSENLRVRPDMSLGFPGTDMTDMREERDEDSLQYHITATFLGLYGASSPLPTFYTEELLDDANEDVDVVRDFIDIVNIPLYPLLIRAWTKYRAMIKVVDEQDKDYIERMFCLCGFGMPELRAKVKHPNQLLRYIGLFTQWPRSAMGLATMLSDALGKVPVDVEPCVHRRVCIPEDQRLQLGIVNNVLGEEAVLGEMVDDRLGKIKVRIGPMDATKYHDCLPGTDRYEWIVQLIQLYLVEPLECDIELVVQPEEVHCVQLGNMSWSALGLDTWSFSSESPGLAEAIFHPRENTL